MIAVLQPKYYVRQVRIPNEIYLKIKLFCVNNQITMLQFYSDMLDRFFSSYELRDIVYRASEKKGYRLSVYVNYKQAKVLKKLGSHCAVSEARIIHTALIEYLSYCEFS